MPLYSKKTKSKSEVWTLKADNKLYRLVKLRVLYSSDKHRIAEANGIEYSLRQEFESRLVDKKLYNAVTRSKDFDLCSKCNSPFRNKTEDKRDMCLKCFAEMSASILNY